MKKCDLRILKNETEKILDCAIELCTKYNDKSGYFENNILKPLESEKEKLGKNEYVIAFLGSVKAGKSTLINALLGRKLNPTQHEAKTALPNLISYDVTKKEPFLKIKSEIFDDLVQFAKSKQKELNLEKSYQGESEIYKFLNNLNDIYREFLKEKSEDEIENFMRKFKNIDDFPRILVDFGDGYKFEKNSKVTFIDTPGANEAKISSHLRKIFNDTLQRASKVVMVVDYSNIDKDSDNKLFGEFLENTKAMQNNKEAILLVANKIDTLTNKEDREARVIKDKICNRFENKIKSENILPFSAQNAIDANFILKELSKEEPDNDKLMELDINFKWIKEVENRKSYANDKLDLSGLSELKNVIKQAFENTDEKIVFSTLMKINGILKEYIENAIKTRQSDLKKSNEEIAKEIENIKSNQEQLKRKIPVIKGKFEKELKKAIESSQNLLDSYFPSKKNIQEEEENEENDLNDIFEKLARFADKFMSQLNKKDYYDEENCSDELNKILKNVDEIFKTNSGNIIKCHKRVEEAFKNGFKGVEKKLENNLKPNLSRLEKDIQTDIEKEILKNIEIIKQNLGDDINIKIPFLKNTKNDTYEIEITTKQSIYEDYWEDDDGFFDPVLRFIDKIGTKRHWGQRLESRKVGEEEVLDKVKARENIKKLFYSQIMTTQKALNAYENEAIKYFNDAFVKLEEKIKYLLSVKEDSLNTDRNKNDEFKKYYENDSEFFNDLIARLETSTNLAKE